MRNPLWMAGLGLLVLVSCATDKTIDTLVPANAVAVIYVEQPLEVLADGSQLVKALGQTLPTVPAEFPVDVIDVGRPWAGAVVPVTGQEDSGVPAFALYLPLKDAAKNFPRISDFALKQGGLTATLVGSHAILSSPGAPAAQIYPEGKHFDLARAHLLEGRGVSLYVDMKNVMDSVVFPEALTPELKYLPLLEKELNGLRMGFYASTQDPKEAGVRMLIQTDLKSTSSVRQFTAAVPAGSRLEDWSRWLEDEALVALGVVVPPINPQEEALWAAITDKDLRQQLKNVRTQAGPRFAVNLSGGLEPGATEPRFSGVLEAADPQALRQALKSLVASGVLQRNFLQFAMDSDTPLVYQDQPGGPLGMRTRVSLGPFQVNLAWGDHKVFFASGTDPRALDTLSTSAGVPSPWKGPVPAGSSALVSAHPSSWAKVIQSLPVGVGRSLQASVQLEKDGNPTVQIWWGADGIRSVWETLAKDLPELLSGVRDLPPPEPLKTRP